MVGATTCTIATHCIYDIFQHCVYIVHKCTSKYHRCKYYGFLALASTDVSPNLLKTIFFDFYFPYVHAFVQTATQLHCEKS